VDFFFAPSERIECPAVDPAHVECSFCAVEEAADAFRFFRCVACEVSMLPVCGEVIEFVCCDEVVGRVGGLLLVGIDGRAFDGSAACGINGFGPVLFHYPKNLIDPVHSPVAERSVAVVEELAKALGVNLRVERSQRGRAAPHIPVESLGRLGVGVWLFLPAAVEDERTDGADFSGVTFL